jgi:hypothetical protein
MNMDNAGGTLHGSWDKSGGTSITSDRRLKTRIVPLQRTVESLVSENQQEMGAASPSPSTASLAKAGLALRHDSASKAVGSQDGVQWMLRQLRPVSYSFKTGVDSKNMRFGFIADELETVVPQLVRSSNSRNPDAVEQKQIALQDLVALLTAAAQSTQATTEQLVDQVTTQQKIVTTQQKIIEDMRAEQARMMEQLQKLLQESKLEDSANATKAENAKKTKKSKKAKLLLLRKRRSKVERQRG